jgi:hypothetical protein
LRRMHIRIEQVGGALEPMREPAGVSPSPFHVLRPTQEQNART